MQSPKRISARAARREVGWEQALLVCAYESNQKFEEAHLLSAISLDDFKSLLPHLSKDLDIIFYCDCPNDATAARAAAEYQQQGFSNAMVLDGGVNAWRECGYNIMNAPSSCN